MITYDILILEINVVHNDIAIDSNYCIRRLGLKITAYLSYIFLLQNLL